MVLTDFSFWYPLCKLNQAKTLCYNWFTKWRLWMLYYTSILEPEILVIHGHKYNVKSQIHYPVIVFWLIALYYMKTTEALAELSAFYFQPIRTITMNMDSRSRLSIYIIIAKCACACVCVRACVCVCMCVCLCRFYLKTVNGNVLILFATWRNISSSGFKIITKFLWHYLSWLIS